MHLTKRYAFWLCQLCLFLLLSSFEDLTYRHFNTSSSLSLYVLEVDPQKFEMTVVHANDSVLGRQTVESLAKEHNAIAAVNGGFFKGSPWDGLPAGILKIKDRWFAWPTKTRGAIGWTAEEQKPIFDRLTTQATFKIQNRTFIIDGLNRPRKNKETLLFFPEFNRTTLTDSNSLELVIRQNRLLSVREQGNSFIPPDGYVISFPSQRETAFWRLLPIGTSVELIINTIPHSILTSSQEWNTLSFIVGGTPLLIQANQVITDFSSEETLPSFLSSQYARTAVGLLPNGHWLFVVIDKHAKSKGITIKHLAHLMHKLGCVEALNLDGGGSSTLFLNNQIMNDPHGDEDEDNGLKKLRKVSDAILIKERV